MTNHLIKEAILKYIDGMDLGNSTTIGDILKDLGYGELSFEKLMDIDLAVTSEINVSRGYMIDRSAYEDSDVGLPYNLPFVKVKKD